MYRTQLSRASGFSVISQTQPRQQIRRKHHPSDLLLHNSPVSPAGFPLTCVGDLGRAGAGDAGASMWFGLAVGLGRGETSSGGDGVFAMRSGPESLDRRKAMARTYISCCLFTSTIWCNGWTAFLLYCHWHYTPKVNRAIIYPMTKTATKLNQNSASKEVFILRDPDFWNICLPDHNNLRETEFLYFLRFCIWINVSHICL